MSDPFGSSLFRVPMFFKEGTGINLTQDGTSQALELSVDSDALADILGSSLVSTDYQESVRVVATTNITLFSTQTIDGIELAAGDRVLLTGQTAGANNRIYTVQNADWTIADGWDVTDTITSGTLVPIEEGTTNGGKIAQLTTANPITLGTTALVWSIEDASNVFISNFIGRNVNPASVTLNTSYAKNWIYLTRNGTQTVTIPTHTSARFEIGTEIIVQMWGTGTKTIQAVSGSVTLNGTAGGSVTITTQYDAYILKKKANNFWSVVPWKDPSGASGSAVWGGITGTLANQTDLQTILDEKLTSEAIAQMLETVDIGVSVQAWDAFLDDIAALTDPNADRLLFWDDSAGDITWLTLGTGLTITGTTIDAAGGGTYASIAETNAGTEAAKAVTPDGLAGSKFGTAVISLQVTDPAGSALTTGNGKAYWRVPSTLNGMDLVGVAAALTTASSSGIPTFQIHNVTQAADMLTTSLTIDASETDSKDATTAAVIDTANDDVATGDMLRVDCDVAGTGAKGLIIELQFRLP